MNPVAVAAKGKGPAHLARRARAIGARYGVGPARMDRCLADVLRIVDRHRCGATLPVTAATADRHPEVIARYAARGIEFAVHGLHHIDHRELSDAEQRDQLGRAQRALRSNGIPAVGFRAPYLRWSEATLDALRHHGFLYDSSQAMHWPIDPELETEDYRRGLGFCASLSAEGHPVLPRLRDGIVRIPCCLPDDESAVDRMRLPPHVLADVWVEIQRQTYERGELFTMQVHPERIGPCARGIEAVLDEARAARPGVWVSRLDAIARWWRDRTAAVVSVRDDGGSRLHLRADGPDRMTILVRNLDVPSSEPWADGYRRTTSTELDVRCEVRPFVGVHPDSSPELPAFLREQGYIVEIDDAADAYATFLRSPSFAPEDERALLARLDAFSGPLVRLGRWPDAARSAVAITGDVDALTIWDYALRFVGR